MEDLSDSRTVSRHFIADWLVALRHVSDPARFDAYLAQADLLGPQRHRVRRAQIVRLYQVAAVDCGDEMMGLWSRPIRAGALKHLLTTLRDASDLPAALYRFTTFWNLLLDDYRLELREAPGSLGLALVPRGPQPVSCFGHMLMLKLAHGLMSWLAGRELPLSGLSFAFGRPSYAADYAVLFPAQVAFGADVSMITFARDALRDRALRTEEELSAFLQNAPRDWIFTGLDSHSVSLQVRVFLARHSPPDASLAAAAKALGLTPRTLMRRLGRERSSFQEVKDGLRRDLALRWLLDEGRSVEEISQDLGFSAAANFHRAFRRWTGETPGNMRQMRR